jgi:hypothetical protein
MAVKDRWMHASPWVVVGVVLSLWLGGNLGGSRAPIALAQGPTTGEATGTIAFTSGNGPNQFLYVIDTRSQALAVYRIDPLNPKGAIKLEAARQYRWDLKLAEYNNQPPEVTAIESMVSGSRK